MKKALVALLDKLRRHAGGNVVMLVALSLPALMGSGGLAVDLTQWYLWKRELQQAVDQAAIAGAWARADATTLSTYQTRATQEYTGSLQLTRVFAGTPSITIVNHDGGTGNAVQVVASGRQTLPFTGMFMARPVEIRVSARALLRAGGTYSSCIVALHPSAEGAFTLGGNASGSITCGVAALSDDADAAMLKNGNSSAQLGQLIATGGIDADFAENGTMHPFTSGLMDPFGEITEPDPSVSPSRTYSCPQASTPTTATTATKTSSTVVTHMYVTGNNSNQAVNNASQGTSAYNYSPATAGSTTVGSPQVGVAVPANTVAGTFAGTPAYTYVRQVMNSPKVHEVRKTVATTAYSNVQTTTTGGSDGIARPLPGTYGSISIACETHFQPGIYLIDNIDFGQNIVVRGEGVLFVIREGNGMHINSKSDIHLSGVTKDMLIGTYGYSEEEADKLARMVIYDRDSTDQLKINGNADVRFDGTLYMPAREVWFNGTASASGICMMVVASKVTFTGTVDLENFCLPAGAETPKVGGSEAQVRLVA